jgi:hypothetical protein
LAPCPLFRRRRAATKYRNRIVSFTNKAFCHFETKAAAVIVKRQEGFYLLSRDGSRKLGGPYETREEAAKREQLILRIVELKKRVADAKRTDS